MPVTTGHDADNRSTDRRRHAHVLALCPAVRVSRFVDDRGAGAAVVGAVTGAAGAHAGQPPGEALPRSERVSIRATLG